MGDRYDRRGIRAGVGTRLMRARGKPPPSIIAWGLGQPASLGHNNGPPIDDETPGYLFRRYRWTKAHAAVWKTPSMGVLKFRMARAEAAGLSYRDYMLTLLDSGRFAQARDADAARKAALGRVRAAWAVVLPRLAPDAPRMQSAIVLASLTAAYDDEARSYHNLIHLAAVLDELERYAALAIDADIIVMAALFHDVIYDATRNDNEIASARLARMHLGDLAMATPRIDAIAAMIEATRHRDADIANSSRDTALLLDCDLAILAAPLQRYVAYADAVRREYAHVRDEQFKQGRARVLEAFLARRVIYLTPALAAKWEARARANLAAELRALR